MEMEARGVFKLATALSQATPDLMSKFEKLEKELLPLESALQKARQMSDECFEEMKNKFKPDGENLAEFQILLNLLYQEEVQTMNEVNNFLFGKNLEEDMATYDPRKLNYDHLERVLEKLEYS